MSAAHDQEYFCDGVTEELISALAATKDLRVVARTSSFAFKGKSLDIHEIGRELRADAIVEGSVRRSGGDLRITAQLIRVSDGYHLWAKSYDRKAQDVLAVEQEIAELITTTLRRQISAAATGTQREAASINLEAHDYYLLGRYHWNHFEPGELLKAIEYFEKAIALDPNSSMAYSGLADAYSYLIDMDFLPASEILPKARAAADRALALNPNSAEAHTARGLVAHELEWDQRSARQHFLRAIELNPNYAYGIHWYAHFLEFTGHLEEAAVQMERALANDPLARLYTFDLAMIHYRMHHFDQAMKGVDRAQALEPEYFLLDMARGMITEARRGPSEALAFYRKANERMQGSPASLSVLARAEALAGDAIAARGHLAALKKSAATSYVPDWMLALIEYALNNPVAGRVDLRKSVKTHSGLLVWMKSTALFDRIRSDPQGKELIDQIGGPASE